MYKMVSSFKVGDVGKSLTVRNVNLPATVDKYIIFMVVFPFFLSHSISFLPRQSSPSSLLWTCGVVRAEELGL